MINFEKATIEGSIAERFELMVSQYSERVALTSRGRELTYAQLNRTANRIAREIIARQGATNEPIALLFEHDIWAIVALMGVLKAGKAYTVLNPSYPPARLNGILDNLQATIAITDEQHLVWAQEIIPNTCSLIALEQIDPTISAENLNIAIAPDTPAGIFYTSGSTGKPKGVIYTQGSILHRIWLETNTYQIHAEDKVSLLYSCSFGASVADIFNALLNGGTLCLYDLKQEKLNSLALWIERETITLLHLPIALFRQLATLLTGEENFSRLRRLVPSGKLYRSDVELFRKYFPLECLLVQRFSSTETSLITLFHLNQHTVVDTNVVPVGYPVADKEVLLLDSAGNEILGAGVGEIAVRSRYLSLGYWRNLELTREKFLPSVDGDGTRIYLTGDLGRRRADGCLELLERKDLMVKIRGYRVELAEVEATLLAIEGIQEAVVTGEEGGSRLIAYLVSSPQRGTTVSAIRQKLAATLPDYAIPAVFVYLEQLPLTPNGKIDRHNLPAPPPTRPALDYPYIPPRNPVEEIVAHIWSTVLGIQQVSIYDNFFDLGGHSLLAVRLVAEIEKTFGKKLPLATLFHSTTVEQLANILSQKGWSAPWSSLVPIQPLGTKPPFFCVHLHHGNVLEYRDLPRYLDSQQPVYGLQSQGLDGKQAPLTRIEDMASHYIKEIRTLQPEGPYFLGAFCYGGPIALEMAIQLHGQGQKVALLALIESFSATLRRKIPFHHRVCMHLNMLWQLTPKGKVDYVLMRVINHMRIITEKLANKFYLPERSSEPQALPISHVVEANLQAVRDYVPQVYPGRITVFYSKEDNARRYWQHVPLDLGWSAIAQEGVDIHEISGMHNFVLTEPHVRVLAEKLQACLEQHQ